MPTQKHPSSSRYPLEVKQRASSACLPRWSSRASATAWCPGSRASSTSGQRRSVTGLAKPRSTPAPRPGTTSEERERIVEHERENCELRKANQILKGASVIFAQELDRPRR